MRNMYRMLMIGLGAALITFGLVGIPLSSYVEVQRRENWVLIAQRAGASVSSFTLYLSPNEYMMGVNLWVHDNVEGYYSILDSNRTQVAVFLLSTTDKPSEWKGSEGYFRMVDSGYYTFELFNATFSGVRSTLRLSQRRYVDEYLYPYRSFLWGGVFSLVVGVPLVIMGLASPLMHARGKRQNVGVEGSIN